MLNNHLIATTDLQKTLELLRQVFILYAQVTHKNRQILPLLCVSVQIMLAKASQMMNNNRTTKSIHGCTPFKRAFLLNRQNHTNSQNAPFLTKCVSSFVGLIGANTTPFTGNTPSRVLTVVETQRPIFGRAYPLTKINTGASKMNANTIKNRLALPTIKANTLTKTQIIDYINHASPIVLVAIGFVLGLPLACLVVGILFAMGV